MSRLLSESSLATLNINGAIILTPSKLDYPMHAGVSASSGISYGFCTCLCDHPLYGRAPDQAGVTLQHYQAVCNRESTPADSEVVVRNLCTCVLQHVRVCSSEYLGSFYARTIFDHFALR